MQFIPALLAAYFRMAWPTFWEWSLFLCNRRWLWKWESTGYCEQQWSWTLSQVTKQSLLWGSGSGWIRFQELALWPSVKVNRVEQTTVTHRSCHHLRGATSKEKRRTEKWERRHEAIWERNFSLVEHGWVSMSYHRHTQHGLCLQGAPRCCYVKMKILFSFLATTHTSIIFWFCANYIRTHTVFLEPKLNRCSCQELKNMNLLLVPRQDFGWTNYLGFFWRYIEL